jgi:hypothetical protein
MAKLTTGLWTAIAAMFALLPGFTSASTFAEDIAFLRTHTEVIVLKDEAGAAQVAVVPAWQGRVMTSAAQLEGPGFGWINRKLIVSGKLEPHINVYGGEDRFWLGPEGGQFSIFFAPLAKFEFDQWFVPKPLDSLPFQLVSHSQDRAAFKSSFALTNYSGAHFDIRVEREIRLLSPREAWAKLGVPPAANVALVAYESDSKLINVGKQAWRKETGLLSIWILGMFTPSPQATIVVPFKAGSESQLGAKVTSDYFGSIPDDRIKVTDKVVFLSGDGKFRSKIGVGPKRALGKLGSYDPDLHVLTIVQFNQPSDATEYVNSLWKIQQHPFSGDAANAYNDGPPTPGAPPLGPFYELESSSPAAALRPGEGLKHIHRTIHLTGPESELDAVARSVLGVSLADIEAALNVR